MAKRTAAIRTAHNGTVDIAFETFGAAGGRPLLLVMGLDSPMQWWPDGFCAELADRGFHVARFDIRDCGKSTRFTKRPVEQIAEKVAERPVEQITEKAVQKTIGSVAGHRRRHGLQRLHGLRRRVPGLDAARNAWPDAWPAAAYTANDMVGDGLAVMDELGWSSAHIVGASLGAGLALATAVRCPGRVRSVVSIMGLPTGFRPAAAARYINLPGFARFVRLGTRITHTAWEDLNVQVDIARLLASPGHPFDAQWAFATASACRLDAPGDPGTGLRQLAAMRADEGLLRRAAEISAPLLVLHGADDPLIKPAAATALTRRVPGAKCVIYADMGHEIPRHLWAEIAGEIERHTDRGERPHGRVNGTAGASAAEPVESPSTSSATRRGSSTRRSTDPDSTRTTAWNGRQAAAKINRNTCAGNGIPADGQSADTPPTRPSAACARHRGRRSGFPPRTALDAPRGSGRVPD